MSDYVSPIGNCPIIGDNNWQDFIKQGDELGFGRGYEGPGYGSSATEDFPAELLIDMDEWDERIEEQDRNESSLFHMIQQYGLKVKNQGSLNYCWAFSPTWCLEIIRAKQSEPYRELSATSVGAMVKNFRNVGGWGTEALEYLSDPGPATVEAWPERSLDKKLNNASTNATRTNNKVLKWWKGKPKNLQQFGSLLLHRIPVSGGHDWWSHQISHVQLLKGNGRQRYRSKFGNTWDITFGDNGYGVLEGDRMVPDDISAPAVAIGA